MKNWWRYVARERMRRWRERVLIAVAWHLPRSLVYWCAIRLGAHATTKQPPGETVPELGFTDALASW